jgi:transcriptional regulator with XRE-family HTH domain
MARQGRQLYPHSLLTYFGAELRRLREQAGLSMAQLAEALGYSPQWIGAIELADEKPSPAFAEDADTYFKADGMFARLLQAHDRETKRPKVPPNFPKFADLERKSDNLRVFDALLITGLLQTEDYARNVLSRAQRTAEELEQVITDRMARQQLIVSAPAPRLWIVQDEGALRRAVAPREVMHAQYRHLIEMSMRPNIVLQVVPLDVGGYGGLEGSFTVLTVDGSHDVGYIEAGGYGQVIEAPKAVGSLSEQFELIRAEALSIGASRDLIKRITEGS